MDETGWVRKWGVFNRSAGVVAGCLNCDSCDLDDGL